MQLVLKVDEIAEVVSTWTGIPVQKMMQGEMAKLVDLEDKLHERVVGQDEAVSAVAGAIRRNRAGPVSYTHLRTQNASGYIADPEAFPVSAFSSLRTSAAS